MCLKIIGLSNHKETLDIYRTKCFEPFSDQKCSIVVQKTLNGFSKKKKNLLKIKLRRYLN